MVGDQDVPQPECAEDVVQPVDPAKSKPPPPPAAVSAKCRWTAGPRHAAPRSVWGVERGDGDADDPTSSSRWWVREGTEWLRSAASGSGRAKARGRWASFPPDGSPGRKCIAPFVRPAVVAMPGRPQARSRSRRARCTRRPVHRQRLGEATKRTLICAVEPPRGRGLL